MKVATIIGARPQFIKSAPVSAAFQKVGIKEFTIHTGQHYDSNMSAVFFDEMNLPQPNYRLNCGGIGHSEMIGNMLLQLTPILKDELPDYVLVYGDTNSTLAGALAANKLQIPLIHVEAGLRSYNLEMPEEMNRILTDRMSSILFTPSSKAVKNLEREGFKNYECKILDIGDVMFDALLQFQSSAHWIPDMGAEEFFDNDFGLVTLHRFENIHDRQRLAQLVQELNDIHKNRLPLWMPLHPATSNKLEEFDLELNIYTAPPVGYLQMLWLLKKCKIVLTDSGGLQKEAYFSNKPCITLREETEWVELLESGCNKLHHIGKTNLNLLLTEMLSISFDFSWNGYGTGNAAEKIAQQLSRY